MRDGHGMLTWMLQVGVRMKMKMMIVSGEQKDKKRRIEHKEDAAEIKEVSVLCVSNLAKEGPKSDSNPSISRLIILSISFFKE
jgi:hypothetical protein